MQLKVLIGCEESGAVRDAFLRRGHAAVSCDINPSLKPGPHLQCDVREILNQSWDLGIFFPPCTYVCGSGLHWNKRVDGREAETIKAIEFAELLWAAPIPKIAIENPVGCLSTRSKLGKSSQIIQPYEFGHDASKKTCLWLKGLPPLIKEPANRVAGRIVEWPRGSGKFIERWANQTDSNQNRLPPSDDRAALRGFTYEGIAEAMAAQWGGYA